MLSASISGDVFASPSAKAIGETIRLASAVGELDKSGKRKRDVLVIINYYTGDQLNFSLAIEKSRGKGEFGVESVVVADDVSLLRHPTSAVVGPRGWRGIS